MIEALWSVVLVHPYLALFPLILLEGPVATVVAGSLVAAGTMSFPWAGLLVVAAELTADTFYFTLGRLGRRGRVSSVLARLGLTPERRAPLETSLVRNLPKVLAGAKVADAAAIPVILAAGAVGVGYGRFIGWNLALSALKGSVLLGVGLVFGAQVTRLLTPTSTALLAVAVVSVITAVTLVRKHRRTAAAEPTSGARTIPVPVPTRAGSW